MASTLYTCDLRKGDLFVLSWAKAATSEAGKYLFSAANVWWSCAQYFVMHLVARETIAVCIWHLFVFMSVVVIVLGSVGMFVV